jgi:HlyD family secretion protein
MTANVTVRIERRDDVLRAPNAALRFRPPYDDARAGRRSGGGAMAAGMGQGGAQGGNASRPGEGRTGEGRSGADSARAGRGARRGGDDATAGGPRGAGGRGAPGDAGGTGGLARRGDASVEGRPLRTPESDELTPPAEVPAYRPGAVYVLKNGKPERVGVMTGITDGALTEVQTEALREGDLVVVGFDQPARAANPGLQPPPGMGGFRGPGGGGGGRGGR